MVASQPRYRFTVEAYQQIGRAGIIDPARRVELIDGAIVGKSPIGPIHTWSVNLLNKHMVMQVRDRGIVSVQNPIRLGPYDEPQPDLAVIDPDAVPGNRTPLPMFSS